jgi:hypothetical protein
MAELPRYPHGWAGCPICDVKAKRKVTFSSGTLNETRFFSELSQTEGASECQFSWLVKGSNREYHEDHLRYKFSFKSGPCFILRVQDTGAHAERCFLPRPFNLIQTDGHLN